LFTFYVTKKLWHRKTGPNCIPFGDIFNQLVHICKQCVGTTHVLECTYDIVCTNSSAHVENYRGENRTASEVGNTFTTNPLPTVALYEHIVYSMKINQLCN